MYGYLENGSFTGIFKDIVEERIDFSLSHTLMTHGRNQVSKLYKKK